MDKKLQEAIDFFQKEKGFYRLLKLFVKKYKGLGRIGGSVRLMQLKTYEQEALSSFFGKDFFKQKSATISFQDFINALSRTKFEDLRMKDLLEGYTGQELLTNEEEKVLYEERKRNFFEELMKEYPHSNCQLWLGNIIYKRRGTRGIHKNYEINLKLLKIHLKHVLSAISQLPKEGYERLPLFAQRITKNPHGFDRNTEQGRLFLSALQCIRENKEDSFQFVSSPSAEETNEIMQFFHIVRDDIQNFVTCAGILALDKQRENPLPLWLTAWQNKNVLNVPLREVEKIGKCLPADNLYKVFIVENSGVFSAILDNIENKKKHLPPLICTHGQFKLATLMLLDKLVENNVVIYYSGDFDPEGLQMAQRLAMRYSNQLKIWCYGIEEYQQSISEITLTKTRIKKLESITMPQLTPVKERIIETGKVGYQEELIDHMVEDILNHLN